MILHNGDLCKALTSALARTVSEIGLYPDIGHECVKEEVSKQVNAVVDT